MEKPVVFLSHSSKDKFALCKLKDLLDSRAAGSLQFFLSSDGQSIRFGTNWTVSISDALNQAKLMFVLLSASSVDSKWIHFEAGCAYANKIHVVPVCLPGLDLKQVTAPLSHLQGFNLHSAEALDNLARICNETFDLKIAEHFAHRDFDDLFEGLDAYGGFFGQFSWSVNDVVIQSESQMAITQPFDPTASLRQLAADANIPCQETSRNDDVGSLKIELPGCVVDIWQACSTEGMKLLVQDSPPIPQGMKLAAVRSSLSPQFFHLNAPLLEKWYAKEAFIPPWKMFINLRPGIKIEHTRHILTAKIFQSGIQSTGRDRFSFQGLDFQFWSVHSFKCIRPACIVILDKRLPELLARLFETGLLYQD